MPIAQTSNPPSPTDEFQWDSAAGDLVIRAPAVNPETTCNKIFRLLEQNLQWPALAVIDAHGHIAGLVTRGQCLSILSKPLMLDLYSKRPVERIMHRFPLAVDIHERIDAVLERIADDQDGALISGFIVTDQGHYVGVATAQGLLVKSVEQARHRAEALEKARYQAEEANLAKSTFLANLSHEIRTPLNGVLANLELLGLSGLDEEQSDLIRSASVAAQVLFEIIGDVLDISKIEAGKLSVEMIHMDLATLLHDIATMMATQAGQRDLTFTSHISPMALTTVRGDPTRLRQVLMNLCGNALKFTQAGGLFFSLFARQSSPDAMEAWIEIADTGIGFAPHKAEQLFQAFTQEDDSTTRRFGGTGLGLSICRQLTELMGGTIMADSEPGEGASFWCRIPLPIMAPADEPEPDMTGLSVLIVDRNRQRGERLAGALISGGCEATVRVDAGVALASARKAALDKAPFDVMLFVAAGEAKDLMPLVKGLNDLSTELVVITELEQVGLRRKTFQCGIRHWTVFSAGQADLRATIAMAAGRLRQSAATSQSLDIASLTNLLSSMRSAKILVIDDTAMNQKVAQRQLTKLGLSCDLADNGRVGLERAMNQRYDLILSDIQMPVMDGYAFIHGLRQWERTQGQHHTPVIAMTANALGGNVRKCTDAGMNDYITKPVKLERLASVLAQWLPAGGHSPAAALPPPRATAPIDLGALSEQLGDHSPESHREVLGMFLEMYPPLEDALIEALRARDPAATKRNAHTAKGAALNAAAIPLGAILQNMEALALRSEWTALDALLDGARREFRQIVDFAASFAPPPPDTQSWEPRRVLP